MTTVCAGRLIPHASVAVQQSTTIAPSLNICSVSRRSFLSMPAWCTPMPLRKCSLSSLLRLFSARSAYLARASFSSESPVKRASSSPSKAARSASARAVVPVPFREWTKTMH